MKQVIKYIVAIAVGLLAVWVYNLLTNFSTDTTITVAIALAVSMATVAVFDKAKKEEN